jgi:cytochrome c oxidase cbb3-type subunit III
VSRFFYYRFCCGCGAAVLSLLLSACNFAHGRPSADSEMPAPGQIMDFRVLYADNCAACHGSEGRGGAAIALADPVYLAIADENAMRRIIADGVRGTSMPAFAQSSGGTLTDKQIDVITSEIHSRWGRPGILDGSNPPSYAATVAGNVQHGEVAYATFCSSCHGAEGHAGPKGSAITNDSFLALMSDQELRTIVIVGRPELGAPDWRGNLPGKPMSNQEITDVVVWLASRRVQNPGQPYSAASNGQH